MPEVVSREERATKFEQRASRPRIDAIMAMENLEERATSLKEYLQEHGISSIHSYDDNFSLQSRVQQIARIDISLQYEHYVNNHWFTLFKTMDPSVQGIEDPLTPALDFVVDRAVTMRRIKAFLMYKFMIAQPKTAGSNKVAASTVTGWGNVLFGMVVHRLGEVDTPVETTSRILGGRTHNGIYFAIKKAVNAIISANDLPPRSRQYTVYGRDELGLLQDDIMKSMMAGVDWDLCMSRLALITIAFVTGLRIGSMCATDPKDSDRKGMDADDIQFQRDTGTKTPSWITLIHVRHLKGYQLPSDRRHMDFTLMPMKLVENLNMDPSVYLLPMLMARSMLREQGTKKLIRTVEELTTSTASTLEGFGGPLFADRQGRYSKASDMNHAIRVHATHVGLPTGGVHTFRKDVATEISIITSNDIARDLLNHQQQQNALGVHYTRGPAMMDLAGLRSGETLTAQQREALDKSTIAHTRFYSLAAKAIASGNGNKSATQVQAIKRKRSPRDHDDMVAEAQEMFPELKKLLDEYSLLVAKLNDPKLPASFTRQSNRVIKQIKERYPHNETYSTLVDTATDIAILMRKATDAYHIKQKKRNTQATASISVPELQDAQDSLKDLKKERATMEQRVASSLRQSMTAIGSVGRSERSAQEETDNDNWVESMEGIPVPSPFDEDGPSSILDPNLIINDSLATANIQTREATAIARLSRIGLLLSFRKGRERFNGLVEYINTACVCPLCTWSPSLAPVIKASRSVGVFSSARPSEDGRVPGWISQRISLIKEHLNDFHHPEVELVLLGGQLPSSSFSSPSVPVPLDFGLRNNTEFMEGINFTSNDMDTVKALWMAPLPSLLKPKHRAEEGYATTALHATLHSTTPAALGFPSHVQQTCNDMMRTDFELPTARSTKIDSTRPGFRCTMAANGRIW
ncbi:unnamed protein product [Sympodiomycopsis kandeliae]